ncbi:M18 family aminopeptidase [Dielma fastidiosa]|uniref:M18 family aminopeptidase n=1 Tax=Dielma fastidiosa TaxID=1034346 RepID=A0AB35UJ97_9FIRM|nr:M18 family aminopeptidase [Dielma fastidiosa]MDY5166745.1 M18 family aminopeptidase [Dielma fastidiosa]HAH94301.1 M18 family aminopeptidase [Dielma fastidiosa]
MKNQLMHDCLAFIQKSPSTFHAVHELKDTCLKAGFTELKEGTVWQLEKGRGYVVTRNGSSILAFKIGSKLSAPIFNITASHSDSPTFKLKENAEIESSAYLQLNTEGYGGMIASSWFDRPLSLAGRLAVKKADKIEIQLYDAGRDLLMIPNVAIHMNRSINSGYNYNLQVDLLPLFSAKNKQGTLKKLIAEDIKAAEADILSMELNIYNRTPYSIWGAEEEFVSSPKLDNLECAYTTLDGFLKAQNDERICVYGCFDNEEVGSTSKQGADSTFLYDVLKRINANLGYDEEAYLAGLNHSFMLSADNAHALHPNHPEFSDKTNQVLMNQGVVVKGNANQKYTTDGVSNAIFKAICEQAGVPLQFYYNRSDMPGGSTLGNLSSRHVSIKTIDIGLAQLAMHSSYETAGIKDGQYMSQACQAFYETSLTMDEEAIRF